jgi:hypothetical protein
MGCGLENVVNLNEVKNEHAKGLPSTINGNGNLKVECGTMEEESICINAKAE